MKWLQELPGNATQRWMPVSGTSGAPPSLATAPPPALCLPPPLSSSAWLSHSSATLKNFQKCIVSTQSGKLSLPKPSGRVAWGLSERRRGTGGGEASRVPCTVASCVAHFPHQCAFILLLKPLRMNEWVPRKQPSKLLLLSLPLSLALRLASFRLCHRPSLLLQVAYASGRQPFVEPLFLVRRALS